MVKKIVKKPVTHQKRKKEPEDRHIICFSYPNCDIDPLGCVVLHGTNAETYGHRD